MELPPSTTFHGGLMHLALEHSENPTPEAIAALEESKNSNWWKPKGDWRTALVHAYSLRCLAKAYFQTGEYDKAVQEARLAKEKAVEEQNDDAELCVWRDTIVKECDDLETNCKSHSKEKEPTTLLAPTTSASMLLDEPDAGHAPSTAATSRVPTTEHETKIKRPLSPQGSESVRAYLEEMASKHARLAKEDQEFEFVGDAGALITVEGVPSRAGVEPSELYLVGVGDSLGAWVLEEGLPFGNGGGGKWDVIAALERDRRFQGVLVAVYDDGLGTRFERADALPLHSFVVNEGEKEEKLRGNLEKYDSFSITLTWHQEAKGVA